jgi:hypothetical protein
MSGSASDNFGAAGALEVSATASAKGTFDTVMLFNLSGATGWNIQSITLQLTATPPNNAIFNSSASGQFSVIWMDNGSWTEGTGSPSSPTSDGITYSTLQSTYLDASDESLGTFTSPAATSGSNTYTLSLPSGFLSAVTSGSTTVSLEIVPSDTNVSYLFNSRTFMGASTAHPLLTVVAVPEPAAFGLAAIGLLAVAGLGFYRSRKAEIAPSRIHTD